MKNLVSILLLTVSLLFVSSCKDTDVVKSISKGVDILDAVTKSLKDAETKALVTPGEIAPYYVFIEQARTNLVQAKTIATNVTALDPVSRKSILTILTTIHAGLDDVDIMAIKDSGTRKRIQTSFLAFGTGIDALRIALQE